MPSTCLRVHVANYPDTRLYISRDSLLQHLPPQLHFLVPGMASAGQRVTLTVERVEETYGLELTVVKKNTHERLWAASLKAPAGTKQKVVGHLRQKMGGRDKSTGSVVAALYANDAKPLEREWLDAVANRFNQMYNNPPIEFERVHRKVKAYFDGHSMGRLPLEVDDHSHLLKKMAWYIDESYLGTVSSIVQAYLAYGILLCVDHVPNIFHIKYELNGGNY